ncbi:hypothetical protein [Pseudaminobacter soli (ex Li et al. 2025)]|uniref:hypothetical protein n=1 Tax=Pseudaminobacter soli (ex Li et al. 2025) TaxID=1295366 RepID=UPI0011B20A14|nr:hypothetical protein [Mesorhizobium soli]
MPDPIALIDCNNFYVSCERVALQPRSGHTAQESRQGQQWRPWTATGPATSSTDFHKQTFGARDDCAVPRMKKK